MRRSKIRWLILVLLLLLAGGLAMHAWLLRHTEDILQELVRQESDGRVTMQVEKARLRYRKHRLSLEQVRLVCRDTSSGRAAFDLLFASVELSVASFSDLLFRGKLIVPTIEVSKPLIQVTPAKKDEEKISLSEALGDVYIYIQKTLNNLEVENLRISDGTFALSARDNPGRRISIFQIGLQVNNFHVDQERPDSSRFFFSDDVTLTTGRESIRFPDSIHLVHYKALRLSTRSGIVELDSCVLAGQSRDSIQGSFELQFEQIRMVDVDFTALYREGRLRMDSLQCTVPKLRLDLVRRESGNPADARAVLSRLVSRLAGDLDIRHASLLRSQVNLQVRKGSKVLPFRSSNDDFYIRGLKVAQNQEPSIAVDAFDFFIRDYISYTADSLYAIRFDSIRIQDEALVLTNLRLQPARPSRDGSVRTLNVPAFVLRDVDWPRLLLDRELAAREAVLERPVIRIVNARSPGTVSAQAKETVAALSKWVLLDQLRLEHANIDVENTSSGTHLHMEDLMAQLVPGELLKAPSLENLEAGLRSLDVGITRVQTPALKVDINGLAYHGKNSGWTATSVGFTTGDGNVQGMFERARINGLQLPGKGEEALRIGALTWETGSVTTRAQEKRPGRKDKFRNLPALIVDTILLHNTALESRFSNDGSLSTFIPQATGYAVAIAPNGDWSGNLSNLTGSSGFWMRPGATIRWQAMRQESGGLVCVDGVSCAVNGASDSIFASIPQLRFRMSSSGESGALLHASYLEIPDAVIRFRHVPKKDAGLIRKPQPWKVLIDTVQVYRAELDLESGDERKLRLVSKAAQLRAEPMRFRPDGSVFFGAMDLQLEQWSVTAGAERSADGRSGRLKLHCDSLRAGGDSPDGWNAAVRSLLLQQVVFRHGDRSRTSGDFHIEQLEAADLSMDPSVLRDPENWWRKQGRLSISNTTMQWRLRESQLSLVNAGWSASNRRFSAEALSLRPYLSADSFLSSKVFETDYIALQKTRVSLEGADLDFSSEPRIHARSASLSGGLLEIRRDKRMPERIGQYKPLPTHQLARLGFDLRIDTLSISNGHVEYTEIGEKSGKAGTVSFDQLEATMTGIRSREIGSLDSLRLRARARFLDTANIVLRFRQSYSDSLAGFVLTAAIAPFDLRALNPVTEPLAATRIRRGLLDSLYMRVVARDYLSRGEMQCFYRELNVDLGNPDRKFTSFLASPVNLIADLFVIRRNNRTHPGLIFYPRNREKSIFNYWVKLTLSGVLTSTGARSNGKYEREYARQLEQLKLPPIE